VVLFDFEQGSFTGWRAQGGSAFGPRPVDPEGELFEQLGVWKIGANFTGYQGRWMVHSNPWTSEKHNWSRPYDVPSGRLVSERFRIDRKYLKFQFAGTLNPGVRAELHVAGQVVRTAHGNNAFDLITRTWDVRDLAGREAHLELVLDLKPDERVLLRADYFRLSDFPGKDDAFTRPTFRGDSRHFRPQEFVHVLDSTGAGNGALCGAQLVQTPEGWHAFAVEQKRSGTVYWGWHPEQNDSLYHSFAKTLDGSWSPWRRVYQADRSAGDGWLHLATVAWHEGEFRLLYFSNGREAKEGGEGDTIRDIHVALATSRDGVTWKRHPGKSVFTHPSNIEGLGLHRIGERWVAYYSSILNEDRGPKYPKASVLYRESADLVTWSEPQVAMRALPNAVNGIGEGTVFLFQRGEYWYLLSRRAQPQWERTRFLSSHLWRSRDPRRFDFEKDYLGLLNVWGSASVVPVDATKKEWRIAHLHHHSRGLWLAPVKFNDEEKPWHWLGLPDFESVR
jgi:hypothetical protein